MKPNEFPLAEIHQKHPMPWKHMLLQPPTGIGGQIVVLDQNNTEVPLFLMVAFMEQMSAAYAQSKTPKEEVSKQ